MLVLFCLTLAAPPMPVAEAAPVPADIQWAAIAASPRVSGGANGGKVATAVCVGSRDGFAYLLTAAHAVPEGEPRAYEFFTRDSYPKPVQTLTRGEVVVRLSDADVALVKLPIGVTPVSSLRLAGVGERSKRFPFAAAAVGCPRATPPVSRAEKLTEKTFVRRTGGGAFFWQAEAAPEGGMSGGPLIDAGGRVIGVCAAVREGRGYYAHLDEIQYGLKQQGYGWLFEPEVPR